MEDDTARLFAAAAAIGIALRAALVWIALPGRSTANCNRGGIGVGLIALNTPTEQTVGSDYWYNFSIRGGCFWRGTEQPNLPSADQFRRGRPPGSGVVSVGLELRGRLGGNLRADGSERGHLDLGG